MGMALESADLWPGEQHLLTKHANLVITIKEHGLSQFAFDKYMGLIGMAGQEALGGQCHLTNYRLIFKTHGLNRLRGKISVFLPTVVSVQNTSWFIVRKVKVETQVQAHEMVMWGIPTFMNAVAAAQGQLGPKHREHIKTLIVKHPEAIGAGLEKWVAIERLNKILLAMRKGADLTNDLADLANLDGAEQRTFFELLGLFV